MLVADENGYVGVPNLPSPKQVQPQIMHELRYAVPRLIRSKLQASKKKLKSKGAIGLTLAGF